MELLKINEVNDKIITIRDEKAILDSDVAELYGVETMRINEAVKNNPDKFPEGYIIRLESEEWKDLKSKISISSWGGKNKLPNVFTEKGLYMLATILKSPHATQTTIAIVETFAKIKELSRSIAELSEYPEEKHRQKSLAEKSGAILAEILGDGLTTTGSETSIELNLALLKVKHTVKRKAAKKKKK